MSMRANYMAEDRPDVKFSCKEFARLMSEPSEGGWQKLETVLERSASTQTLIGRTESTELCSNPECL